MHKSFELKIDEMSKTEGHTGIEIKVRKGKVEDVKLKVSENKRFFTQGVVGKEFTYAPQFISRICGTCSVSHTLCSTEAVEKAIGVEVSDETMLLRKLLSYGVMIRDHAMHLYLFCLPDIFGKDSVLEFDESQHELLHQAFEVKAAGNNLCRIIGGRAIHPIFVKIGGFVKFPSKDEIKDSINELKKVREYLIDLIEIFHESQFNFERKTQYVALFTPDYSFLEGEIRTTEDLRIPESEYWNFLNRIVIPYSQATGFEFEGKEYMVGALARMNINRESLHKDTIKDVGKMLKLFPSDNVFNNNLAQAIEILHSIDSSLENLEKYEHRDEPEREWKVERQCEGIGVIEAPRGTLYHMIQLKKDGKVGYGNFIIPTAQNQIQMEKDIKLLVSQMLDKSKEEIQFEIEKMIRAYDPCFSCASHFLKIKWT